MFLVTVLLVATACMAAKIPSNERHAFVASSPRNDFIPVTMSSMHDFDGDSKKLWRKYPSLQQESSKASNRYIPTSDNRLSLDLYDPPSNYRRRHRIHHSKKQDKQKSKRYITSDEIRPKRKQQPKVSKDISNKFEPSPVDTRISQEYFPSANQYNTNQHVSDESIHIAHLEKLRNDRMSTDFSHPEIDEYSQSAFFQQPSQREQSFNSYSNPAPEMSFSQNVYLPPSEVKQASMQYVPPRDADSYFLPINQVDAVSNQNYPQSNEKDYFINSPIITIDSTPSIQITEANTKDVSNNNMAAEVQKQFPLLPPLETQHTSKHFLPPSYEDEISTKDSNKREIIDNFSQYQNNVPSPVSFSSPPDMASISVQNSSRDDQLTYVSSQPLPISPEYLPLQDFSDQFVPELHGHNNADRRNDHAYGQKSPAVQISNAVSLPYSSTHSQKSSNFTTLRPIKQYNEISQFSQTTYQNNPSNPIERSSHDNSLKTEAIMTNFPTQGQGFDPAKYSANQYPQSMPFGSKLPQQNSVYASPRSSNLPIPGLQTNSDKQYETSTVNLNNKYELANSLNSLRQPGDLLLPGQYEPYQQQHQHYYAKNYAHQSFPADSTTEAVPILKQTNEIAYDGSFHYETLTGDQTHVIQEGHIENPGTDDEEQVIHGSYSFVGGDGVTYTVNYVADSNGFRAAGDHLPTPPPVPEVIQRSIEVNLAAEANKAAQEYQSQSQTGKKGTDHVSKPSHGYLNDQTSRNFDLETKRPIQNYRNPFLESFNNYRSYENPPTVNRNQNQNYAGNNNNQNKGYQNLQIEKSDNNQGYQSSYNDKKSYIQPVNPQSSYSNNPQGIPSTQTNANSNAQGYLNAQTTNDNIVQGYSNAQTSNNNNIHAYKNPHTTFNQNLPEYQSGQPSNINNDPEYKNPESSYINNNQGIPNYPTSNDNNIQIYKNPRIDDNDSSVGYQNSQIDNSNNQGYQNPQTSYNNNIQGYQTQQNGYNTNIQGYQSTQTITDKNDLYSNPQIVDNNQYQSFPTNSRPVDVARNFQSSEAMTESGLHPKETGYL